MLQTTTAEACCTQSSRDPPSETRLRHHNINCKKDGRGKVQRLIEASIKTRRVGVRVIRTKHAYRTLAA